MTIIDDTTTTTGPELVLTPDALTLVRVSPDYFATGDQHDLMPNEDDESRTYYATTSRTFGPDSEWGVILVDHDTDPRGQVGWHTGTDFHDLLGDEISHHGGWNVRRQYLTPVDVDEATPDPRPLQVGDRVRVDNPHAPTWRGEGVITGPMGGTIPAYHYSVRLETGEESGREGSFRAEYLTRVETAPEEGSASLRTAESGAEEGTSQATTAPEAAPETFTREDVDRLVDEARRATRAEAEQRFEDWKLRASEIACQYADENSLCSEFERCMEEIGLQGRNREYAVTFTVTVEARNEDHARDEVVERVYDWGHSDIRYAIDDVEEV